MGNDRGLRREIGGMPIWGLIAASVLIAAGGAYTATHLPNSAEASYQAPVLTPSATPTPSPTALTISVVGDSNTEVNSDDFAGGKIGDASWVSQLLGNGYTFRGGWADGGTTSGTQADNLAQLDQADITLIMTGTNDLGQGVAFADTRANIDRIVAKAPANRVILLAIPPRDAETRRTTEEHNADLQQLAQERGWEFFDGLTFLRAPEGGYIAGVSDDGVHLNREAQARYGQIIREHLAAA